MSTTRETNDLFPALCAVAAAAEATTRGPVDRSPALRAALRQLHAQARGDRWPFDQLWDSVGDLLGSGFSATESGNFRHAQCHAALRGIMRSVGYPEHIEGWARLMEAARGTTIQLYCAGCSESD